MIDHVNVGVSDLGRSRLFFEQALKPLGYEVVLEHDAGVGFGANGMPSFWISDRSASGPLHIAFQAVSRAAVDAFYAAALASSGTCSGAPGLRPQYHPSYYGGFVLDPDGNNIEAVTHVPE